MALNDLIKQVEGKTRKETVSAAKKSSPVDEFKKFVEDVGTVGLRGASTMALGAPEFITRKVNPQLGEELFGAPRTMAGKIMDVPTQLGAMAVGGAGQIGMRLGMKTASKLGGGIVANAIGGGLGGAVAGGAQLNQSSDNLQEFAVNQSMQALGGGLFGLSVGTLAPTLKAVANMRNIKGERAVKIYQNIRDEFHNVKAKAVEKFGKSLDDLITSNPTSKISLTEFTDGLETNVDEITQEVKNLLKKTPQLKSVIERETSELTVKEVQDAINYLNTKVPQKPGPLRNEVISAINDLKASQLDAFPEMASVRNEYRQVIEPFNNVKKYFKFNAIQNAIKGEFGGEEGKFAIKQLLSKETIEKIGGMEAAMKLSSALGEFARNLTIGISSGVGAGYVFNRLMRNKD